MPTTTGIMTTLVRASGGDGTASADGSEGRTLSNPFGLAVCNDGTLVVCDLGVNRIAKVTPPPPQPPQPKLRRCQSLNTPVASLAAGRAPAATFSYVAGAPGDAGYADGIGANSKFKDPLGIAICANGEDAVVVDADNWRLRRLARAVPKEGASVASVVVEVTTVAGTGSEGVCMCVCMCVYVLV